MSRTDLLILPGFNSFSISLSIVDMFIVAYLQETIGPDRLLTWLVLQQLTPYSLFLTAINSSYSTFLQLRCKSGYLA